MYAGNVVNRLKLVVLFLTVTLGSVTAGGCSDQFGPRFWNATPDTLVMYSASRVEYLGFRSALDIAFDPVSTLPIEAPGLTGNWDVALTDGVTSLELVSAHAFDGSSRARIALMPPGTGFDELARAPSDTLLYTADGIPLQEGRVYVIRSRRAPCGLSTGSRYAKIMPVVVNGSGGVIRFAIVRNPHCDDRSFVPPVE